MIISGWRASAVHAAVELGLPDHIAAGRTTSAELAAAAGATEEGIRRLLRLLVAISNCPAPAGCWCSTMC